MNDHPEIKYCMSKFANVRALKEAVMADGTLTDIEKLKYIFNADKEDIKLKYPSLYYAILGVLDSEKISTPMGLKLYLDPKIPPINLDNINKWVWAKTVDSAKTFVEAEESAGKFISIINISYDKGCEQYIEFLRWLEDTNRSYLISLHSSEGDIDIYAEMYDIIGRISL